MPPVVEILKLLRLGIGVHHSGLLPILKELVELLFQEQLIKVGFLQMNFGSTSGSLHFGRFLHATDRGLGWDVLAAPHRFIFCVHC